MFRRFYFQMLPVSRKSLIAVRDEKSVHHVDETIRLQLTSDAKSINK